MAKIELTDAEVDVLLERFDQTEPKLQRRIIATFVAKAIEAEGLLERERMETVSLIRNIASRIGVARSPMGIKDDLEQLAHHLEFWATTENTQR